MLGIQWREKDCLIEIKQEEKISEIQCLEHLISTRMSSYFSN